MNILFFVLSVPLLLKVCWCAAEETLPKVQPTSISVPKSQTFVFEELIEEFPNLTVSKKSSGFYENTYHFMAASSVVEQLKRRFWGEESRWVFIENYHFFKSQKEYQQSAT